MYVIHVPCNQTLLVFPSSSMYRHASLVYSQQRVITTVANTA